MSGRFLELVRYGIVGVFNAGTYLGLYSLLIVLGMPYVLAAVVAFPLPVAFGYWLHEHWTFARHRPTLRGLSTFLLLQVLSFAFSLLVLILLVSGLGVNAILARAVTTVMSPLLVYLGGRVFVFTDRRGVDAGAGQDAVPGSRLGDRWTG